MKRCCRVLFLLFFLCACLGAAEAEKPLRAYRQLLRKGFPKDYAEPLAYLQQRHPAWTFMPLMVTQLDSRYTWSYVLDQETKDPRRSLISNGDRTKAYFHPSDTQQYDAGCRRASVEAVAFFLDPRNFLNDRDIFQFENLRCDRPVPLEMVEAVLKGTFMAEGVLENGKSHAEYLCELGKVLRVSPLHLAARMRSEQGVQGTPLVSGKCGSLLWRYYEGKVQEEGRFAVLAPASGHSQEGLLAYDGLFNYFNREASGTGRFAIYLNGMKEAQRGTPEMAKQWGSPRWDARWKAIYGGAFKVAGIYVGNYQNTPYLQKWNVDARCKSPSGGSRNFWGQYMQNIGAAFDEGRSACNARKKLGLPDQPLTFLIPVYAGMPSAPSPDPADGKCVWYPRFEPGRD